MTRKHPLSSWIPLSRHVVPAPSPARGASPRPPSRPSWGLMGPAGPGIGRTIPFLAGCVKSRVSQPEVAGPSWSSQRPRHALPHAPVAYPMRWPLGATARRRCWRRRRPKRPSQIFLAGRRRRAALDCRPALRGHGNGQKTKTQQSTSSRQRVGAAETLGGPWNWPPTAPAGI